MQDEEVADNVTEYCVVNMVSEAVSRIIGWRRAWLPVGSVDPSGKIETFGSV